MQKRQKAFSLIELMVVIAIVGVLAAVAVPAYQRYILSAQAGSLIPIIDSMIVKANEFANLHGHFPTGPGLAGYGSTDTNNVFVAASAIANSPYLKGGIDARDISTSFVGGRLQCGLAGKITLNVAYANSYTTYAYINCFLAHKNGVIESKCFYAYNTQGATTATYNSFGVGMAHPLTGDLIPGMINQGTGANLTTLVNQFVSGATCI